MILNFYRKGNIVDGVALVVILFILAIFFITGFFLLDELKPSLEESLNDTRANQSLQDLHSETPGVLDGIFVTVFALLWIGAMLLAYFVDNNPILFVIALILLVVVFVIGGFLSNAFGEYNLDLGMASHFPMITFIMDYYLHFILGIVSSILIALFAKSQT